MEEAEKVSKWKKIRDHTLPTLSESPKGIITPLPSVRLCMSLYRGDFQNMQVTQTMIYPALKMLQIASALNVVPLEVNVETGHIEKKSSKCGKLVNKIWMLLAVMKAIHCFYVLITEAIKSFQDTGQLMQNSVLTALLCCAILFNFKLCHDRIVEMIPLFNSLRFSSRRDTFRQMISSGFKMSWIERLLVLVPVAANIVLPFIIIFVIFFPHWPIVSTSVLHREKQRTWMAVPLIAFDALVGFFCQVTYTLVLTLELGMQIVYLQNTYKAILNDFR